MEQKKPLALLLIFIIILMAMGIAFLFARHKAPSVSTGYTGRYNYVQSNAPLGFNKDEYTQLQNLKDSEFLGIVPSKNEENPIKIIVINSQIIAFITYIYKIKHV